MSPYPDLESLISEINRRVNLKQKGIKKEMISSNFDFVFGIA